MSTTQKIKNRKKAQTKADQALANYQKAREAVDEAWKNYITLLAECNKADQVVQQLIVDDFLEE